MILWLLATLFAVALFHYSYWRRRKLPPGPMPLPLLGNTLSFIRNPIDDVLARWKREYGDIHTVWIGDTPVVTLHNVDLIQETFIKDGDTYAGRPIDSWNVVQKGGPTGIGNIDGPVWRHNRRFSLQVLRDFGLGRNLMQERILGEVTALSDRIREERRKGPVLVTDEIDMAIGSIINGLTLGYSFGKEDRDKFLRVKGYAQAFVSNFTRTLYRAMEGNIELLRRLPIFRGEYEYIIRQSNEIRSFFMEEIEQHRREIRLNTDEEPRDLVDAFLQHQQRVGESEAPTEQLFGIIFDLWVAGQETTSTTLAWVVVFLMEHPEVQKQLHAELDREIACNRLVELEDKSRLHLLNAFVAESMRCANLVPFNLMHRIIRPVTVGPYNLPKDTIITHQISSVMRDERYFPEPERFYPARFLDAQGKFFLPPAWMPFGVGKRACMGESLARAELFLFTANLCHQFVVSKPPGYRTPKRLFRGTAQPEEYKCILNDRL